MSETFIRVVYNPPGSHDTRVKTMQSDSGFGLAVTKGLGDSTQQNSANATFEGRDMRTAGGMQQGCVQSG